MPDDPKLTHPLEELVAIAKGRCFGTKRGAVRCSLAARGGHITCKRHTAQEGRGCDTSTSTSTTTGRSRSAVFREQVDTRAEVAGGQGRMVEAWRRVHLDMDRRVR